MSSSKLLASQLLVEAFKRKDDVKWVKALLSICIALIGIDGKMLCKSGKVDAMGNNFEVLMSSGRAGKNGGFRRSANILRLLRIAPILRRIDNSFRFLKLLVSENGYIRVA